MNGFEDTVMDIAEDRYDGLGADSLVEIQAEITWPIAEKAGIREVMEWMNEPCEHVETTSERPIFRWGCRKCWQAFTKEQGL